MKTLQLLGLVTILSLPAVAGTAFAAESGRNYTTYQGATSKANPSNYETPKAATPAATTAAATTTAAPAAAPATAAPAAAPATTAPAAATPATTPQVTPPVFKDATQPPALPTAEPAAEAPADECAAFMTDNNTYQACKDRMLKYERLKSGNKARSDYFNKKAAPPAAAPATTAPAAAPAPAATPAVPEGMTGAIPDTPATTTAAPAQ